MYVCIYISAHILMAGTLSACLNCMCAQTTAQP